MKNSILTFMFTALMLSSTAFAGDIYSGTSFWLKSHEDVRYLKFKMKQKNVKVILQDVTLKLGTDNEYIYKVCVGYEYDRTIRFNRNRSYVGNMPRVLNEYHSPMGNMWCDVDSEEIKF